ncbi:uncharacterized protein TNCV_5047201 [Trichonephila clavipes]|nr:uncharacterized protein TNCV_5047201 [Trichonephila clavipes]
MQKISAVPKVPSSFQQTLTDSWSRTAVHVSKGEKQEKRCLEHPNLGEILASQFLGLVVVTRCCLNLLGVLLLVQRGYIRRSDSRRGSSRDAN